MGSCREYLDAVALLKDHGFTLERTKKHKVWKHSDGRTWVMPTSPSDASAWKNNIHDLKNFLGINGIRGVEGKRRPRKTTHKKQSPIRIYEETANVVPRDMPSQMMSVKQARESVALQESISEPEETLHMSSAFPIVFSEIKQPEKVVVIPSRPARRWWNPLTWRRG